MGLIEQAAKRLEELRRAGVEAPDTPRPAEPLPAARPVEPVAHGLRDASIPAPKGPRPARLNLDLALLAEQGFITPTQPRSRIADEFRVIKRPLIANAAGKAPGHPQNGNLIMVTSSVPGEGKTFCAVNLAMSIAMEVDRTVLLVDADVARPALPQRLGVGDTPGLLDILGGRGVDVSQVLHHTNVEKLTFMSSGRTHERAAEMLASDAMMQLLRELSARYPDRIIVFDSPPLLVTTEARALATRMGQIVFVVSAETTLAGDVTRALATIEACPVKMTVLNKATVTSQGGYGYGYSYGY